MLDFTLDDIGTLIDFIDCCFIENIRDDASIDNMHYVASMYYVENIGSIYQKLHKEIDRMANTKEGVSF